MFGLKPLRKTTPLLPRVETPFSWMAKELPGLFNRLFTEFPIMERPEWPYRWGLTTEEKEKEVVIRVELPGFEPEDVKVELTGERLTVEAEHKEVPEKEEVPEKGEEKAKRIYAHVKRMEMLPEGIEPGFILAVGTVEPRKNYPRLLIAYRRLRGRPGVPQLVVAGRAGWAYGDTLRRIAAEPGVRYLGHVDEPTLAALYEHASVLAFPSLYEGFGLPLLEAMSRGVPAVVGTAGALPELGMGAAISVDAESSDAIAGALERLLVDEGLRKEVGQEGIRRARDYTWASAAERVLAAMHRISRKSEKSAA